MIAIYLGLALVALSAILVMGITLENRSIMRKINRGAIITTSGRAGATILIYLIALVMTALGIVIATFGYFFR